MRLLYIFGLFTVCFCAHTAFGAQIQVDSSVSVYNRLDTFYIPVRIDTHDECINAVDVTIAYDPTELSVQDVATGGSILTLWTKYPEIERNEQGEIGRVSFEGGIPGGYCGRVEGDPGLTNVLVQLVVTGKPQALEAGTATTTRILVEPQSVAYLHDGSGAPAQTTLQGASITLVQATSSPVNIWLDDVRNDVVAPELFDITFVEGPSAGNKYHYIVFSTTDKQSGVDHYEVLETDPDQFGLMTWFPREAYWVEAESPYVLRDQRLRSKILVKAVDKNGNERVVEYVPPMSSLVKLTLPSVFVPLVFFVLFVCILVMGLWYMRKRKKSVRVRDAENTE